MAELIAAALERELACPGTVGRLTDSILRETRMPAVQIELPESVDPAATTRIARSIVTALRQFFEG